MEGRFDSSQSPSQEDQYEEITSENIQSAAYGRQASFIHNDHVDYALDLATTLKLQEPPYETMLSASGFAKVAERERETIEQAGNHCVNMSEGTYYAETIQVGVPNGECSIHVLLKRTGGESILERAVLIDGGNDSSMPSASGEKACRAIELAMADIPRFYTLDERYRENGKLRLRFDAWVITHWDEDHYTGAMCYFIKGFRTGELRCWRALPGTEPQQYTALYCPNWEPKTDKPTMHGHHSNFVAGRKDGYCRGERISGVHVCLRDASEDEPMFWLAGYSGNGEGPFELDPHLVLGMDFFTGTRDPRLRPLKTGQGDGVSIYDALALIEPSPMPRLLCLGIKGMFLGEGKEPDLNELFRNANISGVVGGATGRNARNANDDEGDDAADDEEEQTGSRVQNKPKEKQLPQTLQNLTSIATAVVWVGASKNVRVSTLWMGDAVASIEKKLATRWGSNLGSVKVLKLSHHGSRGSTPPELLDKVRPERCVVSAGSHYWHTDPKVLERLHQHYAAAEQADNHRFRLYALRPPPYLEFRLFQYGFRNYIFRDEQFACNNWLWNDLSPLHRTGVFLSRVWLDRTTNPHYDKTIERLDNRLWLNGTNIYLSEFTRFAPRAHPKQDELTSSTYEAFNGCDRVRLRYLRICSFKEPEVDGAIVPYADRSRIFENNREDDKDRPSNVLDWLLKYVNMLDKPTEMYPMFVERFVNLWFRHRENRMPIVGFPPKAGRYSRTKGEVNPRSIVVAKRAQGAISIEVIKWAMEQLPELKQLAFSPSATLVKDCRIAYHSLSANKSGPTRTADDKTVIQDYAYRVFRSMLEIMATEHPVRMRKHLGGINGLTTPGAWREATENLTMSNFFDKAVIAVDAQLLERRQELERSGALGNRPMNWDETTEKLRSSGITMRGFGDVEKPSAGPGLESFLDLPIAAPSLENSDVDPEDANANNQTEIDLLEVYEDNYEGNDFEEGDADGTPKANTRDGMYEEELTFPQSRTGPMMHTQLELRPRVDNVEEEDQMGDMFGGRQELKLDYLNLPEQDIRPHVHPDLFHQHKRSAAQHHQWQDASQPGGQNSDEDRDEISSEKVVKKLHTASLDGKNSQNTKENSVTEHHNDWFDDKDWQGN